MNELALSNTKIPRQVLEEKVIEAVANALDLETDEVELEHSTQMDLGAESLDYLDIAFTLERQFQVHFPREDLLQRASDHFGEETLVKDGELTDLGLRMLSFAMPEVPEDQLKPGLKAADVPSLFKVGTFVRILDRLLAAKEGMDRTCPSCGDQMEDSNTLPEMVCPSCEHIEPFPSGDDVLFHAMVELSELKKKEQESEA